MPDVSIHHGAAPRPASRESHTVAPPARAEGTPRRPRRAAARVFEGRVTGTEWVTPGMRRLTIAAPEFTSYSPLGADEYLGLLLPKRSDSPFSLPAAHHGEEIRTAVAALPAEVRPDLRWYTLRAHRPELAEIDIDFVVHGDEGPGTRFARHAEPGSTLGIRECTALWTPPPHISTTLIAGDESAIPAISRILETSPDGIRHHVFIETADARDRQDIGTGVTWVDREGRPGAALERAVRNAAIAERLDAAWVCGERGGVQQIRRHLIADRGLDKAAIVFSGYWREGEARL